MDVDVYAVEEMLLFNMNLLKTCVLLEVVSYESIYIRLSLPTTYTLQNRFVHTQRL